MQDKQSSFCQTISHLARAYTASLNARLQPLGLSQARYQVLSVLEADGEQTQRDLARRLGVEQATMANTLTRMTRDGLIVRKPHPDDGRAQLVALTQAARDLVAPAHQATKEADESLLENLLKQPSMRCFSACWNASPTQSPLAAQPRRHNATDHAR